MTTTTGGAVSLTACAQCGQPHRLRGTDKPSCQAHRSKVRPLAPCGLPKMTGQRICHIHGGKSGRNRNAARRKVAEEQARRVLWKVDASPVTDPVDALQRFAGRLLAAEEAVGVKVNELTSIRSTTSESAEQVRGEVQVLTELLKLVRATLVDLGKLNLEDRQVRLRERLGDAVVLLLEGVVRALGFDPADPEVRRIVEAELVRIDGGTT